VSNGDEDKSTSSVGNEEKTRKVVESNDGLRVKTTCHVLLMPNLHQLAFLASLSLTFSALVLAAHFINNTLLAAGYDVSNLILIGLPGHPTMPFVAILTSPAFVLATLIVVGAAIYSSVIYTGSSPSFFPGCSLSPSS
jgi:hypothetical protein